MSRNDRLVASAWIFIISCLIIASYLSGTVGFLIPLLGGSALGVISLIVLIVSAFEDDD